MNNDEAKARELADGYVDRYLRYAFRPDLSYEYMDEKQYEAVIVRLTHRIEKGLSAPVYRQGTGGDLCLALIAAMCQYGEKYDIAVSFYETAMSTLKEFVTKNKAEGIDIAELEEKLRELPGNSNGCGGARRFAAKEKEEYRSLNFKELIESRHSIRHFSPEPVLMEDVMKAIEIAQFTPSACNRQGWKSRIIVNEEMKGALLKNQNGNRGFGEEIDKLIVVTFDLRFSNIEREVHQAFIEGGMYAMSILYALHYMGIAAIPLSGSLRAEQDNNVRKLTGMEEAEVLIMFIGIGKYADECMVTQSKRKRPAIQVI